jgi:hypothetical protein
MRRQLGGLSSGRGGGEKGKWRVEVPPQGDHAAKPVV